MQTQDLIGIGPAPEGETIASPKGELAAAPESALNPAPSGAGFNDTRIWYHGTRHDFEVFDLAQLGRSVNNPTTRMGFFFTDSIEGARYWTERRARDGARGEARILEVFLSVQKSWPLSAAEFQYLLLRAQVRTIDKLCREAKAAGFDSFSIARENGERWMAVFSPDQIRIATKHPKPARPPRPM